MECFRLYLHDSSLPIRGQPAGLFGNKRHRITLVQQSQFSSRVRTCLRVKEHPTFQHIPMEISHQRPDITGRVWTLRCLIFFLAILDKFFHNSPDAIGVWALLISEVFSDGRTPSVFLYILNLPVNRSKAVLCQKCIGLAEGPAAEKSPGCGQGTWVGRFQYHMLWVGQHGFLGLGRPSPQDEYHGAVLVVKDPDCSVRKLLPPDIMV